MLRTEESLARRDSGNVPMTHSLIGVYLRFNGATAPARERQKPHPGFAQKNPHAGARTEVQRTKARRAGGDRGGGY